MKSKNKRVLATPHVAVRVSPYATISVKSFMTKDQKVMLKALSALLI